MKHIRFLNFILGFLIFCPLTFAATISVNTFEDEIADDDDCSLREAIFNANDNAATHNDCTAGSAVDIDVIELEAGVYCIEDIDTEDNTTLHGDLDIAESLTIAGLGSGLTILDGGSSSESVAAGCSTPLSERILHVVIDDSSIAGLAPDGITVSISGLTMRGGLSTDAALLQRHGGAFLFNGVNSNLNLTDVKFIENAVNPTDGDGFGGALSIGSNNAIDFTNVEFSNNDAVSINGDGIGGAIYFNTGTTGTIVGLSANGNYASTDVAFQEQSGGFLYLGADSNVTITNATISNNSVNNVEANSFGGGIYVVNGSGMGTTVLTLQSVTLYSNSAQQGGAIYDSGSDTEISVSNSLFDSNQIVVDGPNCIGIIDGGTSNFAADTSGCTFAIEAPHDDDPIIGALSDNGGLFDTFGFDATSPLVDAGDCSGYTVTTDQRGDGFAREVGACDVGAFELQEHTDVDADGFFAYAADITHLDCDDSDDTINPDGTEVCDGADNNCDGDTDEASAADAATWYHDSDVDGFGDAADSQIACTAPSNYVADDTDCNDSDDTINSNSTDLCDGIDNNCDGDTDEDFTDLGDACTVGIGACSASGEMVCTGDGSATECDAVMGSAIDEVCDAVDNDCDGDTDEDFTDLGDACTVGLGACADVTGEMVCAEDGLSTECSGTAGTEETEICDDAIDNDCDGDVDSDDSSCLSVTEDTPSGGCQLSNGPAHSNSSLVIATMGLLATLSFKRRLLNS